MFIDMDTRRLAFAPDPAGMYKMPTTGRVDKLFTVLKTLKLTPGWMAPLLDSSDPQTPGPYQVNLPKKGQATVSVDG